MTTHVRNCRHCNLLQRKNRFSIWCIKAIGGRHPCCKRPSPLESVRESLCAAAAHRFIATVGEDLPIPFVTSCPSSVGLLTIFGDPTSATRTPRLLPPRRRCAT